VSKPCPKPMKVAYTTKRLALSGAAKLHKAGQSSVRMQAYKCRCGKWHLTKRGAVEAEISSLLRRSA
jgi:hypothetical protein